MAHFYQKGQKINNTNTFQLMKQTKMYRELTLVERLSLAAICLELFVFNCLPLLLFLILKK